MRGLILSAATCAAVVLVGLSGCGGDGPRGRVHGKITVQGKPVPNLAVVFLGSDNRTHPTITGADGAFAVDGVALGTVKVSVQAPAERAAVKGEFDPPPRTSAAKGVKDEKAGKTAQDNAPKAPPGAKVAPKYTNPDQSGLTFELTGPDQEWSTDLK